MDIDVVVEETQSLHLDEDLSTSTADGDEHMEPLHINQRLKDGGCCDFCSRLPLSASAAQRLTPLEVAHSGRYSYPLDTLQNALNNVNCPVCALICKVLRKCYAEEVLQAPANGFLYMRMYENFFHLPRLGIELSEFKNDHHVLGFFLTFETSRSPSAMYMPCLTVDTNQSIRPSPRQPFDDLSQWVFGMYPNDNLLPTQAWIRPFTTQEISQGLVSAETVKTWIRSCDRDHQCLKEDLFQAPRTLAINVIDVHTRTIVPLPTGARYICLSYIWGPRIGQSEIAKPSWEGVLPETIPNTIKDAVTLTSQLEEKYLWCDVYCIPQSDEGEKQRQINAMNEIFRGATLTIIALASPNSFAGLLSTASSRLQFSCQFGQEELRVSLIPNVGTAILSSEWNTRGWTMQEALLSRRRLFIADDQIFLGCGEEVYHDFLSASVRQTFGVTASNLFPPTWDRNVLNFDIARTHWDEQKIQAVFRQYSLRKLSFESDALNALKGILNEITKIGKKQFVCAVPTDDIWTAFCWCLLKSVGSTDSTDSTDQPRYEFPSWSWLRARGEVLFFSPWSQGGLGLHKGAIADQISILWVRDNRELRVKSTAVTIDNTTELKMTQISSSRSRVRDRSPENVRPSEGLEIILIARWKSVDEIRKRNKRTGRPTQYELSMSQMDMNDYDGNVVWAISITRREDEKAERTDFNFYGIPADSWDAARPEPIEITLI